jgi:hypothetical protein
LNGSAPRLQHLSLWKFSFPSLPRFLLSATDLTSLHFWDIPNSGYILPDTCLSALPKHMSLFIEFESPTPQVSPPPTRFVLPALEVIWFKGASEYLEHLVTRIDTPLLRSFRIDFFHQIVFDIPQTIQFFDRLELFRFITPPPTSIRVMMTENSCGRSQVKGLCGWGALASATPPTDNLKDRECRTQEVPTKAQMCGMTVRNTPVPILLTNLYLHDDPLLDSIKDSNKCGQSRIQGSRKRAICVC